MTVGMHSSRHSHFRRNRAARAVVRMQRAARPLSAGSRCGDCDSYEVAAANFQWVR